MGRLALVGIFTAATALAFGLVWLTEDDTLSPTQRQARAELRRLETFFKQHHRILGRFPTAEEGFTPLIAAKLIPEVPVDPWGRRYVYQVDGAGRAAVFSYGADGVPGGSGEAADLSSRGVLEARP
jgi:general secretion pathway protein G